jgi:hypothetical protein
MTGGKSPHMRFVQWQSADDLRPQLIALLVEELSLSGPDDIAKFDATLGGEPWNDLRFFSPARNEKLGRSADCRGLASLSG